MAASTEKEDVSKQLTQQVEDISINNDVLTTCANCGREGSNLNICNKCKTATYCNAACKKRHRSKHKKDCERRVDELHGKNLSAKGEQRICMMRLYSNNLRQLKIVPSACYLCHHLLRGRSTILAAGKFFAVDVFTQLQNEMVASVFVHFAELQRLNL